MPNNSGGCSLGAYELEQIPSRVNGWLFRKGHPFVAELNEAIILNQVLLYIPCARQCGVDVELHIYCSRVQELQCTTEYG